MEELKRLLKELNKKIEAQSQKIERQEIKLAEQSRIIFSLREENKSLKDEISRLNNKNGRPKIPPSALEKPKRKKNLLKRFRNKFFKKKNKRREEIIIVKAQNIPEGSRFKGYRDFTIQEIKIEAMDIKYRCEIYKTPAGKIIRGELPKNINSHFGNEFISYCIHQYYQCRVTQPLLFEHLIQLGFDVSSGQINTILVKFKERFQKERTDVLSTGLKNSQYVGVDDTGARHNGKNAVCTYVGNNLFSNFVTSDSKSRINFLEILQGEHKNYRLDEEALKYSYEQGISQKVLDNLDNFILQVKAKVFKTEKTWLKFLDQKNIQGFLNRKRLTEGALLSSAVFNGISSDIIISSDAAPQFSVFINALCWIHEERHYRKWIPQNKKEIKLLEEIRNKIWAIYVDLKSYKTDPTREKRNLLNKQFDALFSKKVSSKSLSKILKNTRKRKRSLLQVLDYPIAPIHNNESEREIREYVMKRKVSAGTRSEEGKIARDLFLSLKGTCRKLGIYFWDYLRDRIKEENNIPSLSSLMKLEFFNTS